MTEQEMFELSFSRPWNYFYLSEDEQWRIDGKLGILDWQGAGLTAEDLTRFRAHYRKPHQRKT